MWSPKAVSLLLRAVMAVVKFITLLARAGRASIGMGMTTHRRVDEELAPGRCPRGSADINPSRLCNGLQVISSARRAGAGIKQGSEFVIGNAALYPCTFLSTIKLNTRSVTGQIATQILSRSA